MTALKLALLVCVLFMLLSVAASVAATEAHAQSNEGGFNVACEHSGYGRIDPIGFATHLHGFAGTFPTSNTTTAEDMQAQTTNCDRVKDTSGYWIPAVLRSDGTRLRPTSVNPYYRTMVPGNQVMVPFKDLRIVAGDSMSQLPQSTSVLYWDCKRSSTQAGSGIYGDWPEPHDCASRDDSPRLHIVFPQCWNGYQLDSPNHKDHMAYPITFDGVWWGCPATHPYAIPMLNLQYTFPTRNEGGANMDAVYFDSGGRYSMHADWWQTWRVGPSGIDDLVTRCIRAGVICGSS